MLQLDLAGELGHIAAGISSYPMPSLERKSEKQLGACYDGPRQTAQSSISTEGGRGWDEALHTEQSQDASQTPC